MARLSFFFVITGVLLVFGSQPPRAKQATAPADNSPQYTPDGRLKFPANYREWIYLSTGVDMSYGPAANMGHSMFDNVFVNPDSYKSFLLTGRWPDKTMLVLEVKGQDDQEQQTKREFLVEWVRAINGHGGLGTWAADSVAAFVTRL